MGIIIDDTCLIDERFGMLLEPVDNADPLAAGQSEFDAGVIMEVPVVKSAAGDPSMRVGPSDDIKPSRTHNDFRARDVTRHVEERHYNGVACN